MRILLVGMARLKYMPYINFYLNKIDLSEHETHISYWDRDGLADSTLDERIKLHCFRCNMNDGDPLKNKLSRFFRYRNHLKNTINEIKPDFLIIHYQTTAVLIYDLLVRKYREKYILDYRDVTYERFSIFKKIVAKLVKSSYATFISSDGFRSFLPESSKIKNSHNLIKADLENRDRYLVKSESDKIRIAFWGLIRHFAVNERIIEQFANDDRFELHYYGRAQGKILELLKDSSRRYNNIFFHGEYLPEQRRDFAKSTDIIHNIYDNVDKTMPIAMANKFYDGPIFYTPQLCARGSLMGKLCDKYKIGLACDPFDENFTDQVFNYYQTIKGSEEFRHSSDAFLKSVRRDIVCAEQLIDDFLHSER